MYKISVPIMNANVKRNGREETLRELNRLDAERVILALDTFETDEEKQKQVFEELADNCLFFKAHGFEVGAWIWTFWIKGNQHFRNMRSISGKEIREFMCPTDESFVCFAADYIRRIVKCGVDIIQFDDDFRYGFLSDSAACLCDGHIEAINRITGENSTREELEYFITNGGKNKFRDAFLKANGDAFRNFAKKIRSAVNEVNPHVRISLCACMSAWDLDGTDAKELATILAGDTKPLLRLIGAPYWAVNRNWGNTLADVIELERMESAWTKSDDIEIMAEGDAYPRPRTRCPASYIEGFDTAIRVAGCTDGILKYGIDYCSRADYETGYALFHERNRRLYSDIDRIFKGKQSVGVRVYESAKKISDLVNPTRVNQTVCIENLFFSKAARTLAYNTVPTTYVGEGICGIVFDENARNLPLEALNHGLIIDIAAAEILAERGIDVGLAEIGKATGGVCEHFLQKENYILTEGATVYDIKLRDGVEILSDIETPLGNLPMSYRYQNRNGNRFLVLNVNTRSEADNVLKHYERSRQYAEQIPWLGGQELPAYLYGNPALYIQCKKDEHTLSVGLWNFFEDPVLSPVVQLDGEYSSLECIHCKGHIDGNRVILSEISPFEFVGFEVRK